MADEQPATATVAKGGEVRLQIVIGRSPKGVTVTVKAHRQIEEFMQTMTGGEQQDVKVVSRHWLPADSNTRFAIYAGGETIKGATADGEAYTIDAVGQPLITSTGYINLSFLRLVGISDDAGVKFTVRGVYSVDALRNMQTKVSRAAAEFYRNYLRPVDLSVAISTQEMRF